MASTRSRRARVTIGLVAGGCVVLVGAWFSFGVSGEVFLVDSAGTAHVAPGAMVRVFRADGKSVAGFLYSAEHMAHDAEFERERKERSESHLASIQAAGDNRERLDFLAENFEFLERSYDWTRCRKFRDDSVRYFGTAVGFTRADQQGRFSVRLLPGKYVVWATGQAGSRHAEWLVDIQVIWRTNVRLVDAACEYQQ